jgi:dCTP deaminase
MLTRRWLGSGKLDNIAPDDHIIFLGPGETILGHTNGQSHCIRTLCTRPSSSVCGWWLEFLGGRHTVTTMMKARSSLGRNFIEVCKCAGWGDIGYINRWTMEITSTLHLTRASERASELPSDGRCVPLLTWCGALSTDNSRYYSIPLVVGRRIAQIVFFDR